MYVLITGFVILHLLFGFIDAIIVGNVDIVSTTLTVAITANTTTLDVKDTAGFKVAEYVVIGDETIAYNGKTGTTFINCRRGYNTTTAVAHIKGSKVYAPKLDVINSGMGFTIVDTSANAGTISAGVLTWRFLKTFLPATITWNYYFLKEGFWQYLRLVLQCLSIALVVVVITQILSALGGMLTSAWNK